MSSLAPTLQAFFTDRLLCQRRVSPNTIASYRDTFRLLLSFAQQQTGKPPARLELSDLDGPLIGAFLEQLETERGNSTRTRNIRLAAVRSFFHYAALRHPEHASVIQRVLAIPAKRSDQRIVTFLTPDELKTLLASPDQTTWAGRRDHALLLTAAQTGLRVSEMIGLTCGDVQLGTGAHLRAFGNPGAGGNRRSRCRALIVRCRSPSSRSGASVGGMSRPGSSTCARAAGTDASAMGAGRGHRR